LASSLTSLLPTYIIEANLPSRTGRRKIKSKKGKEGIAVCHSGSVLGYPGGQLISNPDPFFVLIEKKVFK
jgi:hypothetical protein